MKERKIVLKDDIKQGLCRLGITEGDNAIVHTSMHSFGFVCGGPQMVIEALLECTGEEGTIMMPTQTWKNMEKKLPRQIQWAQLQKCFANGQAL